MVTILIVEDDEMVRLLTKNHLAPEYKVLEASNGEEALEILAHEHIDLLIVDIQMPKMNGYELMHEEVRQIEDIILQDDNFESMELGLSGSEALITAYAEEKCDRSSEEAVEYYTDMFKDIAGMDIQVSAKSVATGLSSLMSTGNTQTRNMGSDCSSQRINITR